MSVKLPKRIQLRSLVCDAIDDRLAMEDDSMKAELKALIESYRALKKKLEGPAVLNEEDKKILARACVHALMWRESYLDAWKHTGETSVINDTKRRIEIVKKTQKALGVTPHWLHGGPLPDGVELVTVTLEDLRKKAFENKLTGT